MASRRVGLAVLWAAAAITRTAGYQSASNAAIQHRGIVAAACRSALHGSPNGSIWSKSQHDSLSFRKQCPSRSFVSSRDVPPHEEIGMPCLSPTMSKGNIARWRKKEGDEVAAGDVLCEIETDKAIMELEAMDEGYLAKILVGDGARDVEIGEPICIVVEDQRDVSKFSSYQGGSGGGSGGGGSAPPKRDSHQQLKQGLNHVRHLQLRLLSADQRLHGSPDLHHEVASKEFISFWQVSVARIIGAGLAGIIVTADFEGLSASGTSPSRGIPSHSAAPASAEDLGFSDPQTVRICENLVHGF